MSVGGGTEVRCLSNPGKIISVIDLPSPIPLPRGEGTSVEVIFPLILSGAELGFGLHFSRSVGRSISISNIDSI